MRQPLAPLIALFAIIFGLSSFFTSGASADKGSKNAASGFNIIEYPVVRQGLREAGILMAQATEPAKPGVVFHFGNAGKKPPKLVIGDAPAGTGDITKAPVAPTAPAPPSFGATFASKPLSTPPGVNLANTVKEKRATQSSSPEPRNKKPGDAADGFTEYAMRAVDGGTNQANNAETIAQTGGDSADKYPFWLLDLGAVYKVDQIRIYSSERMTGGEIYWSDGVKNTKMVKIDTIPLIKGAYDIRMTGRPDPVRYVRVQLLKPGVISLTEVEVYGNPAPLTQPNTMVLAKGTKVANPLAKPRGTNLAIGKRVSQSSEGLSRTARDRACGVTRRAVDGDTSQKSIMRTSGLPNDKAPWLLLDLEAVYEVDLIRIYNQEPIVDADLIWSDGAKDTKLVRINTIEPVKGVYAVNANASRVRYVRVQLPNPAVLSLAELEVFGNPASLTQLYAIPLAQGIQAAPPNTPPKGVNLAPGKITTQSTEGKGSNACESGLAIDGNTEQNFAVGSFASTSGHASDTAPWWELDMGAVYNVEQIRIYSRTDCCSKDIAGAEVIWSDGAKNTNTKRLKINTIKPVNGVYSIDMNNGPIQYLRIQLPKQGVLSLAEVEVYGDPNPVRP